MYNYTQKYMTISDIVSIIYNFIDYNTWLNYSIINKTNRNNFYLYTKKLILYDNIDPIILAHFLNKFKNLQHLKIINYNRSFLWCNKFLEHIQINTLTILEAYNFQQYISTKLLLKKFINNNKLVSLCFNSSKNMYLFLNQKDIQLTLLKELYLSDINLTDYDYDYYDNFGFFDYVSTELVHLNLSNNKIRIENLNDTTDDENSVNSFEQNTFISWLLKATHLEVLNLSTNQIDYNGFDQLIEALPKSLKILDISNNKKINFSVLSYLSSKIEYLNLANCTIILDEVVENKFPDTLIKLNLSNTKISQFLCRKIIELFPENIKELDLSNNKLFNLPFPEFLDWLRNSKLTYLNLSNTGLFNDNLIKTPYLLLANLPSTLKVLNISDNKIQYDNYLDSYTLRLLNNSITHLQYTNLDKIILNNNKLNTKFISIIREMNIEIL